MANSTLVLYEYADETSIDSDLICSICREPCRDPYLTPCSHLFCNQCITRWQQNRYNSCPICRVRFSQRDLKIAPKFIQDLTDRIQVTCKKCGESGLSRVQIDEHVKSLCPMSIVPCSSRNMKCAWTGPRDQLEKHVESCTSNCLTVRISELENDLSHINENLESAQRTLERTESLLTSKFEEFNQYMQTNNEMTTIDVTTLTSNHDQFMTSCKTNESLLNIVTVELDKTKDRIDRTFQDVQKTDVNTQLQCDNIRRFTKSMQRMQDIICSEHKLGLENEFQRQASNSLIDLSHRNVTDEDMGTIIAQRSKTCQNCTELDLRQNLITQEGVLIMIRLLTVLPRLQILHLSGNNIGDKGILCLVNGLSGSTSLLKLDLDFNQIKNEGAIGLTIMLIVNHTLEYLSLDNNPLSDSGVRSIAGTLTDSNRTLKEISLHNDQQLSNATINLLIRMIQRNSSLEKFKINGSSLPKEDKIKLQQAAKYKENFSLIF